MVHFGAQGVFRDFPKKKKSRKLFTYKTLRNEADETRTRNLRIDSPVRPVSKIKIQQGKGEETVGKEVGVQSLVQLVRPIF